jgi:hypothetical protein
MPLYHCPPTDTSFAAELLIKARSTSPEALEALTASPPESGQVDLKVRVRVGICRR